MSDFETANAVESAIEDAIRLLRRRRVAPDVTMEELQQINASLPELQAELARVHAAILAFLAERGALPSPSREVAEKILESAQRLDANIAANLKTSGVLQLIQRALGAWRQS